MLLYNTYTYLRKYVKDINKLPLKYRCHSSTPMHCLYSPNISTGSEMKAIIFPSLALSI